MIISYRKRAKTVKQIEIKIKRKIKRMDHVKYLSVILNTRGSRGRAGRSLMSLALFGELSETFVAIPSGNYKLGKRHLFIQTDTAFSLDYYENRDVFIC